MIIGDKYTKVKKYYFEKEDQVKQLQNSLAHQRLSQSRTSLDDTEYTARFNRLDGLIAQLAFSIRKNWKTIPPNLTGVVNKDAVATGKQEMTAAGRAFISWWLVEEVFDHYFHPDLEPALSAQLKTIQLNIRRFAPPPQTAEEEEYLISKIVNWRLSTLEGLSDQLRAPHAETHRTNLTNALKDGLIAAVATHLTDPPPPDLDGGVHMIVELVVSMLLHLPTESRDVVIDYFTPGCPVAPDHMKVEAGGIPPLATSVADDAAEQASLRSAASSSEPTNTSSTHDDREHRERENSLHSSGSAADHDPPAPREKKRSMFSALTGTGKGHGKNVPPPQQQQQHQPPPPQQQQQQQQGKNGSGNLSRPGSAQGGGPPGGAGKPEQLPRVRLSTGIGVHIRGRMVLVKAPVYATT